MKPEIVYVPVSGGKDSQMCVALAVDRFGAERVVMVHQNTHFDHPLTYKHMAYMRERYGCRLVDTTAERYADVPDVMIKEAIIPSRFARACTRQLKTVPWFRWLAQQDGNDRALVLLGMRSAESSRRRQNYGHLLPDDMYEMGDVGGECPAGVARIACQLPIVDVTTPAVFEFLRERGDAVNPLYARGHSRVGCYPCVMAGKRDFALAARDPVGRANIQRMQDAIVFVKSRRPDMDVAAFFEHDLVALLENAEADPFGFGYQYPAEPEDDAGCSWCNQ